MLCYFIDILPALQREHCSLFGFYGILISDSNGNTTLLMINHSFHDKNREQCLEEAL